MSFDFEVPSPLPSDALPSPLSLAMEESDLEQSFGVNVTCTDHVLDEARVTQLALKHSRSYFVEVRAFDKAGNMVQGCSSSGDKRGRLSSELSGQRTLTIDNDPPAAGTWNFCPNLNPNPSPIQNSM